MIQDNLQSSRFEYLSKGEVVAIAQYRHEGNNIIFTHTETLPGYEGHGYASRLARQALEDVRRRQLGVVPVCSFIAGYIKKHPEFQALVTEP